MVKCPICSELASTGGDNPNAPFCTRRCKNIDLGNWLDGSYRFDETSPPVPPPKGDPRREEGSR